MLFGGPDNPSEGVSAVKALLRASQEGQRIYRFDTNSDVSVVSSLNISSDVKNEILNALAARKEVSVSGGNVSVSGWTGVGYIIVDTETGAGAYKISGGSNGSFLKDLRKAIPPPHDFFGHDFATMTRERSVRDETQGGGSGTGPLVGEGQARSGVEAVSG